MPLPRTVKRLVSLAHKAIMGENWTSDVFMKHPLKCLIFFQDIFQVILIYAAHFAVSYQQCMYVCDLGAAGHVVNSQKTPSVPAGPGLWPWCSCLGVFVRMSFLIELYIHGVCVHMSKCVLRQLPVYGELWRQSAE